MAELSKPPNEPPGPDDSKYIHTDVPARAGETPSEKTVREAMNDHGRALQKMQGGTAPTEMYPLDKDGDGE